jgi:hypothetical protein
VSLVVVAMIDAVRAQPSALPFARDLLHAVDLDKPLRAMTGCADDTPATMRLAGSRVHDSHVARPTTRRRSGPTKRASPAAQPESSCSPEARHWSGRQPCEPARRRCRDPRASLPPRRERPSAGPPRGCCGRLARAPGRSIECMRCLPRRRRPRGRDRTELEDRCFRKAPEGKRWRRRQSAAVRRTQQRPITAPWTSTAVEAMPASPAADGCAPRSHCSSLRQRPPPPPRDMQVRIRRGRRPPG